MSISQINKLFQNKGCNIAISIILGASVITMLGVGFRGCGANSAQQDSEKFQGQPVVTVGDLKITKDMIDKGVDQQMQQYGGVDLPQTFKTQIEGSVVEQQITNGLALKLAKQQGIDFSDNVIRQAVIQAETESMRQSLESQGKLRPDASAQELDTAYKSVYGKSFADGLKDINEQLDKVLADSEHRTELNASLAFMLLANKAKAKFTPTEDQVKAQFDTYHFKSIEISPAKAGPQGVKAKADQVLKEIKGGLSFEAAMDKYSATPAPKGKKPSDQKSDYRKDILEGDPLLKPLMSLKPGEVSNVITTPGGAMIYKFINESVELPKDYAKQKAALLDNKARSDAAKSVTDEVRKLDTPENVQWSSDGYHVMHDYLVMQRAQGVDPNRNKKIKDIIDRALAAQSDPLGGELAIAVAKEALPEATMGMAPADAAKLKTQVLAAFAEHFPDVAAKLELAEAYIDGGDTENTAATLRDAVNQNGAHTDEEGKSNWTRLNADIKKAEAKKLIEAGDVAQFAKDFASWQKDYNDEKERERKAEEQKKATDKELEKAGQSQTPPSKPSNPKSTATPPKSGAAPGGKPAGSKKPSGKQ